MKTYPSITKNIIKTAYIYAFDKYDGTQIRAEWNNKKGFYKFGTRHHLIDEGSPFGGAISLIKKKYNNSITSIFKQDKCTDALCFFEYYGPSSFAGYHNFNEKMDVVLFDVNLYKKGIMSPEYFIQNFGKLDIPRILYEGQISADFIDSVKNGTSKDMTFEGCVCKGMDEDKLVMFKIKSNAWLNKLKIFCKNDLNLFNTLS